MVAELVCWNIVELRGRLFSGQEESRFLPLLPASRCDVPCTLVLRLSMAVACKRALDCGTPGPLAKIARRCRARQDEAMEEQRKEVDVEVMVVDEDGEAEDRQLLPGLPHHLALECLAQVPMASLWGVSKHWNGLLTSRFFQSLRTKQGLANPSWIYCLVCVTGDEEEAAPGRSSRRFLWFAYDPLPGIWHQLPDMPEEVDFQLSSPGLIGVSFSVQTLSTRDKLFVVAGLKSGAGEQLQPALDAPFVFDIKKGAWSKGSSFRVPRKWCACGVADGKLLLASGCGREWDESVSKSAEMYDPVADTWETVREMSTSKMSGEAMNAVSVGGKLHLSSGNGIFLKAGLVFDPATGEWTAMGAALKRGWRPSTVALDGRFVSLDDIAGKLEVFDSELDCWETLLEDPRLQRMRNLTSCMGKLCGSVTTDGGGNVLRIVDTLTVPPTFRDVPVPQGELVAVQVADPIALPK